MPQNRTLIMPVCVCVCVCVCGKMGNNKPADRREKTEEIPLEAAVHVGALYDAHT